MTNTSLPLLRARVFGRPLFAVPEYAEALYALIQGRGGELLPAGASLPAGSSRFIGQPRATPRGQSLTRSVGATALITIDGPLVNRGAHIGADFCTGMTSYEGIKAQIAEVDGDGRIENVIFDVNSGGGEAAGMFTTAAAIRALRQTKYVVAVVDDVCASAAYGLASAADEIVVSPTSIVGSIGVVMLHVDRSGEMAAKGLSPTLIFAGAHKTDGNPFEPLPESVRASLEADAHIFYDRFVETVVAGRGSRLTSNAIRAIGAKTLIGGAAVKQGLADREGTLEAVLHGLASRRAKSSPKATKGNNTMLHSEMDTSAIAQARASERGRVKAIVELPEAQSRMALALNLAVNSDMSVESAKATLNSTPIVPIEQGRAPAGADANGPEIGPGGNAPIATVDQAKAGWSKALANVNATIKGGAAGVVVSPR